MKNILWDQREGDHEIWRKNKWKNSNADVLDFFKFTFLRTFNSESPRENFQPTRNGFEKTIFFSRTKKCILEFLNIFFRGYCEYGFLNVFFQGLWMNLRGEIFKHHKTMNLDFLRIFFLWPEIIKLWISEDPQEMDLKKKVFFFKAQKRGILEFLNLNL